MTESREYIYKAKDCSGLAREGVLRADSLKAAVDRLSAENLFPISLKEVRKEGRAKLETLGAKIRLGDKVVFTRQLSDLLGAGATLSSALATIAEQTKSNELTAVIQGMTSLIKAGASLSEALGKYPKVFPALYVGMVRSGETCGMLKEILDNIGDYLEREQEIRTKVASAVAYPLIAASVGLLTMGFLFMFVIPRLVRIFDEMHQVLPLPTRLVIGVSEMLSRYWLLVPGMIIFVILLHRKFGAVAALRARGDAIKLRIPFWGDIVAKTETARISRTMGMCIRSGVPVIAALEVVQSVVQNEVFREEVRKLYNNVREGGSIARGMRGSNCFPAVVGNMIAIGEESNTLGTVFTKIEAGYARDLDTQLKVATTLIEPLTILVLGGIVGVVVISILLPIFQMNFSAY